MVQNGPRARGLPRYDPGTCEDGPSTVLGRAPRTYASTPQATSTRADAGCHGLAGRIVFSIVELEKRKLPLFDPQFFLQSLTVENHAWRRRLGTTGVRWRRQRPWAWRPVAGPASAGCRTAAVAGCSAWVIRAAAGGRAAPRGVQGGGLQCGGGVETVLVLRGCAGGRRRGQRRRWAEGHCLSSPCGRRQWSRRWCGCRRRRKMLLQDSGTIYVRASLLSDAVRKSGPAAGRHCLHKMQCTVLNFSGQNAVKYVS